MNQIQKAKLEFVGIDDWSRPVWKVPETNVFFGSLDKLCSNEDKEQVLEGLKLSELCWFGSWFNCEPMGNNILTLGNILTLNDGRKIEVSL
jgi:hypothetical protein